jgi:hypothetical protein
MASSTAADIPTTRGRRKQAKPQRKNGRMKATKMLFCFLVYVFLVRRLYYDVCRKYFRREDIGFSNLRSVTVLVLCCSPVTLHVFNSGLKV